MQATALSPTRAAAYAAMMAPVDAPPRPDVGETEPGPPSPLT